MRLLLDGDITVVGEAGDAAAALQCIVALEPEVVLLDISMPGIDGIAACNRIRALRPAIQVVMLSLWDDPATRARASAAGAVAFVSKQEAARLLLPAIREAAGRSRAPLTVPPMTLDRADSVDATGLPAPPAAFANQ